MLSASGVSAQSNKLDDIFAPLISRVSDCGKMHNPALGDESPHRSVESSHNSTEYVFGGICPFVILDDRD